MGIRQERVEQEIQRELGSILLKRINDGRVDGVTVTEVSVTGDLQQATIYYSIISDKASDAAKAQAGLDKAKGLIRKLLSQSLTMYKVPEISFKQDSSVQYGARIDELINKIHQDNN